MKSSILSFIRCSVLITLLLSSFKAMGSDPNILSPSYLADKAINSLSEFSRVADTESLFSEQNLVRALVGDENKEITLEFGDRFPSGNGLFYNLTATVPLEDAASSLQSGDLDTLRNKAKIGFTLQKVQLPKLNPNADVYLRRLEYCQNFVEQNLASVSAEARTSIGDFPISELRTRFNEQSQGSAWKALAEDTSNPQSPLNLAFDAADYYCEEKLFTGNAQALNDYRSISVAGPLRYFIAGIEANLAYENYDFVLTDDLTTQLSQSEADYQARAYISRVVGNKSYLSATLSYQDSFVGNDPTQVCQSVGDDMSVSQCQNIAIGAPVRNKSTLFSLSYAQQFNNISVQVKATRDFDQDITGVSIPIWFRNEIASSLNAGISIDWNSEADDVTASFFINRPFQLQF